ncbi:hypothetical protein [Candidatus Pelagibacter sp. HIMB1517]|uniref:hypothetical protein n=1 Tax=Candidatus Pelagibacter sp. HIMB1517 TaxID=3413341 RepID=UPI003F879F7F
MYLIKKKIYSAINKAFNLKEYLKLKKKKQALLNNYSSEVIDKKKGFKFLEDIKLNSQLRDELLSYIEKKNIELQKDKSKKKFLINILDQNEINELPNLIKFVLSNQILKLTCDYLNEVPFLANVFLTISPPNKTLESSQLYHLDTEAEKNIKFFFLLNDVDDKNGPFTFIDKVNSKKIIKLTKYDGTRLDDQKIHLRNKDYKSLENVFVGKSGSGLAIDTANCLHYGSRNMSEKRIVLIIYFTTHFTSHYYSHNFYKKIDTSELTEIQKNSINHFKKEIFTDKNFFKFNH